MKIPLFKLERYFAKGVLPLPSSYFDFGDKNFRVGSGRKNMPEALERLEAYVKEKF